MTDEAKQVEIEQAIEYLREDACTSCIFNSFIGECTSVSDCYARKVADLIESLSAELEQVKRERDAAVEDLRGMCCLCTHFNDNNFCFECMHFCPFDDEYFHKDHWQWRGPQEEPDD